VGRAGLYLPHQEGDESMKNGLYRNDLGAELHVERFLLNPGGYKTLGDTFEAVDRDPLFGKTRYIVTEKSMKECGYELIEEEKVSS
jgi:hypothetical protein